MMKASPEPNGPDLSHLRIEDLRDPRTAEEALARWDELDGRLVAEIEAHPHLGPRLRMLRAADRWVRTDSRPGRGPAGSCPTSEELYDHGRGPGYGPMAAERRGEIDRHVVQCRECEDFSEKLAHRPPASLIVGTPDSAANPLIHPSAAKPSSRAVPAVPSAGPRPTPFPGTLPRPSTISGPRRIVRRYAPLALAASVLAAIGLLIMQPPRPSPPGVFTPGSDLRDKGPDKSYAVKIRGRVLDTGPGSTFLMEINMDEVQGSARLAAALGEPIPGTLNVTWNGATKFVQPNHQSTTSDFLAKGQVVNATFAEFEKPPPFIASSIQIEAEGVGSDPGRIRDRPR